MPTSVQTVPSLITFLRELKTVLYISSFGSHQADLALCITSLTVTISDVCNTLTVSSVPAILLLYIGLTVFVM